MNRHRTSRRARAYMGMLLCFVALLSACHPSKVTRATTEKLHLRMLTGANSNDARPVYYAVRIVNDESAFAEGYDVVLSRTLSGDMNAHIVAQGLLRPNHILERDLTLPRDQRLLLYVFFTSRSGHWKLQLPHPHHDAMSFVVGAKDVEPQIEAKR